MRHSKKYSKRKFTKKYRCVRVNLKKRSTRRNRYKRGGGTIVPPGLPMVIDKNNMMYTCTPV